MLELIEKGGVVMWPLLALSSISLMLIIERSLFYFWLTIQHKTNVVEQMMGYIRSGNFVMAEQLAQNHQYDCVMSMIYYGLTHLEQDLSHALETQARKELRKIKRFLPVLDTIITAAPLLGILGTVLGIIGSFDVLGQQGIRDPMAVTQGISQALITTAYGLIIAIATLIPYNAFEYRYQRWTEQMEEAGSELELAVKKAIHTSKAPKEAGDAIEA